MPERKGQQKVVDKDRAMPLYQQVYLVMRDRIRNGEFDPDRPLPTENDLCDQFNVSRITIKRAMAQLAKDKLVERTRGKGTFVRNATLRTRSDNTIGELLRNVMNIGEATQVRLLDHGLCQPPKEIAERLSLPNGENVLRTRQVRLSKREPIALIETYVPEEIAGRLPPNGAEQPMLLQLQRAGISISRADQSITATLADPLVASELSIEIGAPLIRLRRLVYDNRDQPIEWLSALYRADHYEYRISLSHSDGTSSGIPWQPVSNDA